MTVNNIEIIICIIYTITVVSLGIVSLRYSRKVAKEGLAWKSHLNKLYSGLMLLIAIQVITDIIFYLVGFDLNEHEYVNTLSSMFDTLPVNYVGLILVSIAGHCYATKSRTIQHFFAFVLLMIGYACFPDVGWPWIFGCLYICYAIIIVIRFVAGVRYFNKSADDMYVNGIERRPILTYIFISSVVSALLIWGVMSIHDNIAQCFAEICYIPLWVFMLHTINTIRESELVEPMKEIHFEFTVADNADVPVKQSSEMTATMKYIAENLEAALYKDNFYLNPELNAQLLAERLGTNRTYISRYLNSSGTNFSTLINGMRVEYARKLLLETNDSIPTIVRKCGYQSSNVFSKFFRNVYGCNPEEFDRSAKDS